MALLAGAVAAADGQDRDVIDVFFRVWAMQGDAGYPKEPYCAVGSDGSIYYSDDAANAIWRLNPTTEARRCYFLPTRDSRPAGLAVDAQGNVWYAARGASLVAKLEAKSGKVAEYRVPGPTPRDPRAVAFDDKRRVLWFTASDANLVARLDVKTGRMDLIGVPTANAQPSAIKIDSRGMPFFAESNQGKLASVDPNTLAVTEYALSVNPGDIALGTATPSTTPTSPVGSSVTSTHAEVPGSNRYRQEATGAARLRSRSAGTVPPGSWKRAVRRSRSSVSILTVAEPSHGLFQPPGGLFARSSSATAPNCGPRREMSGPSFALAQSSRPCARFGKRLERQGYRPRLPPDP
jgi:sugar lactone lactonase YvrE